MRAVREADVLDLVDRIYAAGMSFDLWPQALTRMADVFGGLEAALGAEAPHAIPWLAAPRTDPEFLRRYQAYHPLNDYFHALVRRGAGNLATDRMVMPRDELEKSVFHNEWSKPQGYVTKLGGTILAEHGWRTVLTLTGREDFGRDELQLLQQFAPHLKRAVQLNIRLAQGDINTSVTARLLERMTTAAFMLDAGARVLFHNAAAERLFRSGRGLRLIRGVLAAGRPEDDASLKALVGRCATGLPGGDTVSLSEGPGRSILLQAIPVRREMPLLGPGLPAAIVFDASQQQPADPAQRLRLAYGLTASEACFAVEIAKGDGKRAAAERRGISFATARTHLSRIFEKTGVHRQAELVRLVLGDAATPPDDAV
jgi:DNA-binding CsgD family transcriptional regulator